MRTLEAMNLVFELQRVFGVRFSDTRQVAQKILTRLYYVAENYTNGDIQAAIEGWPVAGWPLDIVQKKTNKPVELVVSVDIVVLIWVVIGSDSIQWWPIYRSYNRYLVARGEYYYSGRAKKAIVTHKGRHMVADEIYRQTRDYEAVAKVLGVSVATAEYYLRDFQN